MDDLDLAVEDTRFAEPVAFIPLDEDTFEPFLAMLPHYVVARLMGPDADESAEPLEA